MVFIRVFRAFLFLFISVHFTLDAFAVDIILISDQSPSKSEWVALARHYQIECTGLQRLHIGTLKTDSEEVRKFVEGYSPEILGFYLLHPGECDRLDGKLEGFRPISKEVTGPVLEWKLRRIELGIMIRKLQLEPDESFPVESEIAWELPGPL